MGLDRENKEDRYKAMETLAQAFRIAPENREERNPGELSNREYRLLGLYGDLATMNFRFDPDRMSPMQMSAIERKYSMPMNELKKKYPRIFERLLKTVAIPNLQEARNHYYMQIWLVRRSLRSVLGDNAELSFSNLKEFEENSKELRSMERALARATIGTRLKAPAEHDYDPAKVLARIDAGELKPDFGSKTYNQMKRLAEAGKTSVKYRPLDLASVFYRGEEHFGDIPYSAFLSNGKAMVGYLEKDADALRPVFRELALPRDQKTYSQSTPRLNDKLRDAHQRQSSSPAVDPNQITAQAER